MLTSKFPRKQQARNCHAGRAGNGATSNEIGGISAASTLQSFKSIGKARGYPKGTAGLGSCSAVSDGTVASTDRPSCGASLSPSPRWFKVARAASEYCTGPCPKSVPGKEPTRWGNADGGDFQSTIRDCLLVPFNVVLIDVKRF